MESINTFSKTVPGEGTYTVKIIPDSDAQNPRTDFDHLGTMVYWHRRYCIGDVDGQKEYGSAGDFLTWAKANWAVYLPVYLYDHSVRRVSTSSFLGRAQHAEWDSGQVGFIYVTRENILKEFGTGKKLAVSKRIKDQVVKCLTSEVEVYDQFLAGDVYGYVIEDENGENVESCWGFYGEKYCKEEATSVLEHLAKKAESKVPAATESAIA